MTLEQVIPLIHRACQTMDRLYGGVLFDELAVVRGARGKLHLEWYEGPRREEFIRRFHAETAELKSASLAHHYGHYLIGDCEFTPDGHGSKADAFMKIGEDAYLLLGNTRLSMREVTQNPRWKAAQAGFADLSEAVTQDPARFNGPPAGPEL